MRLGVHPALLAGFVLATAACGGEPSSSGSGGGSALGGGTGTAGGTAGAGGGTAGAGGGTAGGGTAGGGTAGAGGGTAGAGGGTAGGGTAGGGTAGGGTAGGGTAGAGGGTGGLSLALRSSSYLGGSLQDSIRDVTTDGAGNVYFAGGTPSFNLPTTAGVVQRAHHPGPSSSTAIDPYDAFVGKLNASGQLVWLTYLGGPNYDRAYAIEVDANANVYVAGRAGQGFPVTQGAFQTQFMGGAESSFYGPQDGFVCKLTPDGAAVVFCSFFGTDDPSIVRDLAVDGAGNLYLASGRQSGSFPPAVAAAFVNGPLGNRDALAAKVNPTGSQVLWARYLGGSADDSNQNSVRVDGSGNPFVLFTTGSSDVQTTPGAADRVYSGNQDVFVARLAPADGALVYGTYVGGSGNESTETHELAVDSTGRAFVVVPTTSTDFPTTSGVVQRQYGGGGNDISITRLSADGTTVLAATFLGGSMNDRPEGVTVDAAGNLYFTGTTTSPDFPITSLAHGLTGPRDAMVVALSADLTVLRYASCHGGTGDEYGRGVAVSAAGTVWFGGETTSADLPMSNAFQSQNGGGTSDAFITSFAP